MIKIKSSKGYTLLELLITLTLIACLLFVSVTAYTYLSGKNEQQVLIDEITTAVQFARIQALIQKNSVSLAPLDVSLNWSKGMVVNVWSTKTNKFEKINQWQWNHPHWHLAWTGARFSDKVIFSNNPVSAMSNGHFTLTNVQTRQKIVLTLNRLGRIKTE